MKLHALISAHKGQVFNLNQYVSVILKQSKTLRYIWHTFTLLRSTAFLFFNFIQVFLESCHLKSYILVSSLSEYISETFFFKSMLFLFLLCFVCHWYTYPLYVLCSRSTNYIYNLLHCTFTLLLSISILVNQLLENSLNICEIFQWKCKTDVQLQWPKSQRATAETWSKDFNPQLKALLTISSHFHFFWTCSFVIQKRSLINLKTVVRVTLQVTSDSHLTMCEGDPLLRAEVLPYNTAGSTWHSAFLFHVS